MKCSYSKCDSEASYLVVISGTQYPLCTKHFRALLKKLTTKAEQEGSAALSDLPFKVFRSRLSLDTT